MSIEYTLYCDNCRHLIDASSVSPAEVRRVASRERIGARMLTHTLSAIPQEPDDNEFAAMLLGRGYD